jgi:Subtilase family
MLSFFVYNTISACYNNHYSKEINMQYYFPTTIKISLTLVLLAITLPVLTPIAQAQTKKTTALETEKPLSPFVLEQIQSLDEWKENLTLTQRKVDCHLLFAAKMAKGEPITPKVLTLRNGITIEPFDQVAVEIKGTVTRNLIAAVRASGARITSIPRKKTVIYAKVSLQHIEVLASRSDVTRISYVRKPKTNRIGGNGTGIGNGNTKIGAGSVVTEGLYTHDIARIQTQASDTYGDPVLGQNIRVGVISDSNDYQEGSVETGDLPSSIQILVDDFGASQDGRGQGNAGEGTAMMEIIHDLAPNSNLAFATAFNGPESFAQNIRDLRFKMGCDIIVDDVQYFNESPFQDGPIAQAVAEVQADGCIYISSAGNSGNAYWGTSSVWEGNYVSTISSPPFVPTGVTLDLARFGNLDYNLNKIQNDTYTSCDLFWSDPLGQSDNDYDLFDVSADGTILYDVSNDFQDGTQDPYEFIPLDFNIPRGIFPAERIYVRRYSGQARFLHLELGQSNGALLYSTSGNVRGHNSSSSTLSVAASGLSFGQIGLPASYPVYNQFQGIEYFSSDGPRREFYKGDGTPITPGNYLATGGRVLQKPDVSAADGVVTTVPGFAPFYGTSASAPHVAGIAALLRSANLNVPSGEVVRLLKENALDVLNTGFDTTSGNGIVMGSAIDALTQFLGAPTVTTTETTAIITWASKNPVDSYLQYGLTTAYGTTSSQVAPKRSHSITLTGLTPNTTYNFGLKGTYYGYTQKSPNYTFQTKTPVSQGITLTDVLLRREPRTGNLLADITLKNNATVMATGVVVDSASLGVSSPVPSNQTPKTVGDIAAGATSTFTIRFGSQRPGTTPYLRLTGKSANGAVPAFSLTYKTSVP